MTVQDILTKIRNHFQDPDDLAYEKAVKIGWIDSAQQDLARRLPVSQLQEIISVGISTTTIPLESGIGSYGFQLPTGMQGDKFIRIVGIKYGKENLRRVCKIITLAQRNLIDKSFDLFPTATEPLALLRGNLIELFLVSDPSINDTVEISYIKKPDILSQETQSIQLTKFDELIYLYALWQGYARDKQEEAVKYQVLYDNRIVELWQKEIIGG